MTALRTQYVNLTSHADNADGTLTVTAIARRSGIMKYRSDGGDRFEFVPPDLIDARDDQGRPIMGMLAGAPNTLEHPAQVIRYSADSRKGVQVGKVSEEIHIYTDADGERSVKVRFDVSDAATIADIKTGRKTGVSLGYLCNVIREDGEYKGTTYTHRQAMPFTIDHLAIVANPRNPGALITRFDSDDIAVAVEDVRSSFEVIRVDACCAACDGKGKPGCSDDIEEDEPKPKKKKVKTDAEDLPMIPVTFADRIHELSIPQAQALWIDGTIDRVRMDGEDYFMAADVALVLANQGLIHEDAFVAKKGVAKGGGKCGRGWVGVKGSCKRMAKGADRAGAQKAALKDFAQGQRALAPSAGMSPRQKRINQLRSKMENESAKWSEAQMNERMKKGKTAKYRAMESDPKQNTRTGVLESPSLNPSIEAKRGARRAVRSKAFEKEVGMEGRSEEYAAEQDQKAKAAVQKSIDRKGYKNYKRGVFAESKTAVRPDWSSASTISRGGEAKSKAQAEEASKNHYTKRR